jgi:hypothetical protein
MGFRPTPEVRAKLEQAAQANGRSMSQEVESRLEASFLKEEAKYDEFGGDAYYRLGLLLVSVIQEGELISRERWFATPELIDKTAAFLVTFLDGYGRTFAEGPGATSELDYQDRLNELRRLAERMKSSEPPESDK